MKKLNEIPGLFSLPVLVGSLGFFVDIYDLLLFNIVRKSSFASLHVPEPLMKTAGESIISWQMFGLTIGGILWGIMGDKKGRKEVLFASILLYSLATLANSWVTTLNQYTLLRFIAGLGLAGELGASITLVSEMLPAEKRGPASAIIATSGVMGTIAAYFIHSWSGGDWRLCYQIGGAMGLLLLFLRVGVLERTLYEKAKRPEVSMGNWLHFFSNPNRLGRYLRCIGIGLPVWFGIGIMISFSDEFARRFGIDNFDQPKALMLQYVALAFGDLSAGLLSNYFRSRRKTLFLFYALYLIGFLWFFLAKGGGTAQSMYAICMLLGFASGISVVYITLSAEQFGTNLRATAAISIPNLVRGVLPLMIWLFQWLRSESVLNNYVQAAFITGIIVFITGIASVYYTRESYGQSLDFLETNK